MGGLFFIRITKTSLSGTIDCFHWHLPGGDLIFWPIEGTRFFLLAFLFIDSLLFTLSRLAFFSSCGRSFLQFVCSAWRSSLLKMTFDLSEMRKKHRSVMAGGESRLVSLVTMGAVLFPWHAHGPRHDSIIIFIWMSETLSWHGILSTSS